MPQVGKDNVTGDRYTLDLGVEPDLGNLLKNLQVANDLLDQAEAKFKAISDVVGSTTQRLAQATRQTELLATQTERLRVSYQSIASSSNTLAGIGGMAMGGMYGYGMPYGGGGMPYMPGQMAFAGMPGSMPAMSNMGSGGVAFGAQESIPEYAVPPAPRATDLRKEHIPAYAKFALLDRMKSANTPWGAGWTRMKQGYNRRFAAMHPGPGGGQQALPGMEAGAEDLGALGSLGGKAAALTPYVAAGAGALYLGKKIYNTWANSMAASMEMGSLTGGSTGAAGIFGGPAGTGGAVGLGLKAKLMDLLHPGVDYGQIQREVAQEGYVSGRGGMYGDATAYMLAAQERGMGSVMDQLDVYSEAVVKAGGTTAQLTRSLDSMRSVASKTNASLTDMAKNYQSNLETFVSMGMSGAGATMAATVSSTAWARSGITNPTLMNFGGVNMSNPYMQAMITAQTGTPYTALGVAPIVNPRLDQAYPVAGENASINFLSNYGFKKGMSNQDVAKQMMATGIGDQFGPMLQSLGMTPTALQGYDLVEYIRNVFNRPVGTTEGLAAKSMQGKSLGSISWSNRVSNGRGGYFNTSPMRGTPGNYLQHIGLSGSSSIGTWYENYLQKSGKNIPLLDKLVAGGSGDINRTYIKGPNGQPIPLAGWLRQHGAGAAALLESGQVQIATATSAQQAQMHWSQSKHKMVNVGQGVTQNTTGNLHWSSSLDNMGAPGASAGAKGSSTTNLSQDTITKLAEAIGKQVADNV